MSMRGLKLNARLAAKIRHYRVRITFRSRPSRCRYRYRYSTTGRDSILVPITLVATGVERVRMSIVDGPTSSYSTGTGTLSLYRYFDSSTVSY